MKIESLIVLDISVEEQDACLLAILAVGNFEEEEPYSVVLAALRKEGFEVASECGVQVC